MVVCAKPIKGITPVQLPKAGSEDALAHGTPVVGVGYGAYAVPNGPGGHSYLYDDVRMPAPARSTP